MCLRLFRAQLAQNMREEIQTRNKTENNFPLSFYLVGAKDTFVNMNAGHGNLIHETVSLRFFSCSRSLKEKFLIDLLGVNVTKQPQSDARGGYFNTEVGHPLSGLKP